MYTQEELLLFVQEVIKFENCLHAAKVALRQAVEAMEKVKND